MALVIVGGLVTSTTLVNLFIVPSPYLRFGKIRDTTARAA